MKLLSHYIIALSNLYGLISPEKVLEIFNNQNDEDISKEKMEKYIDSSPEVLRQNYVFIEKGLFVHDAVLASGESIEEIYKSRKFLPYYVPEKDELLNYANGNYFEKNEYYDDLLNFFSEQIFHGNRGAAEDISTEVHDYLSIGSSTISGAFDRLGQLDVPLAGEEKIGELADLMAEYARNVRLWEHNGYSLNEMSNLLREGLEEKKDHQNESLTHLEKYIIALTNLYGRVTTEKIAEIYNLQNGDQVTLGEIEAYLENTPDVLAENLVFVKSGEFVSEDLVLFEESYYELVEKQKRKPYYIPERDELFLYLDHIYVDYPTDFQKLVDYLHMNIFINDYDKAHMKAEDIQLALEMGDGLNGAMYEITKNGYTFENPEEMSNFADKVTRLNNNTRMRENHGLTPNELAKIKKETREKVKNIGRNDPCHCGCGKKYKKCCLKKDRMEK